MKNQNNIFLPFFFQGAKIDIDDLFLKCCKKNLLDIDDLFLKCYKKICFLVKNSEMVLFGLDFYNEMVTESQIMTS